MARFLRVHGPETGDLLERLRLDEMAVPEPRGDEVSGVVDALGPDATRFRLGDRVATLPWMNAGYGVNGDYALVPEYYVARYPDNLTANEGAAIRVQYLTAYYGLYSACAIGPDDYLLNCAASSSAGIAATPAPPISSSPPGRTLARVYARSPVARVWASSTTRSAGP